MTVYGTVDTLFMLVGFVLGAAGFLAVSGVTEAGVDIVSVSQLHGLPIVNSMPPEWAYLVLGVTLIMVASAIYGRRMIDFN